MGVSYGYDRVTTVQIGIFGTILIPQIAAPRLNGFDVINGVNVEKMSHLLVES